MAKLNIINTDTLMSTPLPATKFIVEGLLPEGLHLLAGSPKIGKSWLALWACLCVSKGEPMWGLPTAQGTVLYLCLEDSYIRIQSRLFQITDDAPKTLHFANLSDHIGGGLENQISIFLIEHPDTVLIVIDTLQRVRDIVPDGNSYANDYREISSLKKLADEHHIAILLIHHLRKMNDTDPMNMISGTTSISGATDSNFVLKRKDRSTPQAELHCTGRDIESRILELCFRRETHTWELTEPLEEKIVSTDPELIFLSDFLWQLHSFTGTATELSALLEHKTGEMISSALSRKLAKHTSDLEKSGIHVTSSRTREIRQLHITCDPCDSSDGNDGKTGAQFSVIAVTTDKRPPVRPRKPVSAGFAAPAKYPHLEKSAPFAICGPDCQKAPPMDKRYRAPGTGETHLRVGPASRLSGHGARPSPANRILRAEARTHFQNGGKMKKDTIFSIRISSEDLNTIRQKAKDARLSRSEYVTRCCLGRQIVIVDGLKEVLQQQRAIGNNLNRLTVLANMGRITTVDLDRTSQELAAVGATLRAIQEQGRRSR